MRSSLPGRLWGGRRSANGGQLPSPSKSHGSLWAPRQGFGLLASGLRPCRSRSGVSALRARANSLGSRCNAVHPNSRTQSTAHPGLHLLGAVGGPMRRCSAMFWRPHCRRSAIPHQRGCLRHRLTRQPRPFQGHHPCRGHHLGPRPSPRPRHPWWAPPHSLPRLKRRRGDRPAHVQPWARQHPPPTSRRSCRRCSPPCRQMPALQRVRRRHRILL